MSGPRRKKLYEFLARRDGECCFIGGEPGNSQTLVIDHADNDNSNNDPSNLHLICCSMNCVKNSRGPGKKKKQSSVYVCESEEMSTFEPARTLSAELKKNQQAEPDYRHWLFAEIWRKGSLPLEEVIDCGAAVARCSQESVKRYLKKETSRVRLYEIVEDPESKRKSVRFRQEWERHRVKDEERRKLSQAENWSKKMIKDVSFIEKDVKKKVDEKARHGSDESAPKS